jgi:phage terminase large subunit-like protein
VNLPPELHTLAARLAALSPAERAQALDAIAPSQRQAIVAAILDQPLLKASIGSTWRPNPRQAEAKALLDDPETLHVLMYGGARSGKSVLGVRVVIERAIQAPGSRHLIARYRFNSARNSVWRATLPETLARCFPGLEAVPNNSEFFYRLSNGSEIWVAGLDSDQRTEKILGNEFLTALLEECSEIGWPAVEMVTTRVAQRFPSVEPKVIFTENPPSKGHWSYYTALAKREPEPPHKALAHPERWAAIKVNPIDNAENLPPTYLEGLQTGSARKVLRFWRGEFGDASESALWRHETFERHRVMAVPDNLIRIVVAVDPSGTAGADGRDPVGIIAAGVSSDGRGFILEDSTISAGPAEWGKAAVSCFERWEANCIVYESNFGGEMCASVLRAAAAEKGVLIRLKEVHASRGKSQRAEPVAAIYETGRVVHVGHFDELEDELCQFTDNGYTGPRSPNRADAAIWACSEIFGRVTQNPAAARRDRVPRVIGFAEARRRKLGVYAR